MEKVLTEKYTFFLYHWLQRDIYSQDTIALPWRFVTAEVLSPNTGISTKNVVHIRHLNPKLGPGWKLIFNI